MKKLIRKSLIAIMLGSMLFLGSASIASANICDDLAEQTGGAFQCSKDGVKTSFSQFEGEGFGPPDAENFDPGLTQAETARDFIRNTTNFVLGFLGLFAVIIVIYGGVLYVASRGSEDQAEKGKKAITYAVIGILIVLGSFAFVNTIFQAPTGTDSNVRSSADTSGNTVEERQFLTASNTVQELMTQSLNAFQTFQSNRDVLLDLNEIDYVDANDGAVIRDLYETVRDFGRDLVDNSNSFSFTREAADSLLERFVDPRLALTDDGLLERKADLEVEWGINRGSRNGDFVTVVQDLRLELENTERLLANTPVEFPIDDPDEYTLFLENIAFAIQFDYLSEMSEVIREVEELTNQGLPAEIEVIGTDLNQKVQDLAKNPTNQNFIAVAESMSEFFDALLEVKFVFASIRADETQGNAALVVNFDALDSLDPAGETIPDQNYVWSFGNTSESLNFVDCPNAPLSGDGGFVGPTITCIFAKPGTYVANLNVESTRADEFLTGRATLPIKVFPPSTRIVQKVNGEYVQAFTAESEEPFIFKESIAVTQAEASEGQGLNFDVSESIKADGTSVEYRWIFGDGQTIEFGNVESADHVYEREGVYTMILEAKDSRGNVDRKVTKIEVSSPAARITSPSLVGDRNTEFRFNGGGSKTDSGQIINFDWKIERMEPNADSDIESLKNQLQNQSNESEILLRFDNEDAGPGNYKIELLVVDNEGNEDTTFLNIQIESDAPEPRFDCEIPKKNKPATVQCDASKTSDPDLTEGEELEFEWSINTTDDKFEIEDSNTKSPEITFNEIGSYDITLKVTDEFGATNSVTKSVIIDSILDVDFSGTRANEPIVAQLEEEDGELVARISVEAESRNAVAFEWDMGDGSAIKTGDKVNHTYTEAGVYDVEVTVFDENDQDNSIKKRVYVGSSDDPLAVISLKVNNIPVVDLTETVEVTRSDLITFDGGNSINTDGTGRRLEYSWNLQDGTRSLDEEIRHTYNDLGPEQGYEVELVVTDEDDPTLTNRDKVQIKVVSEPPTFDGIIATITSNTETTPVSVRVEAKNPEDSDGRIVQYRWWYYDIANPSQELDVQITNTPFVNYVIPTRGDSFEEKSYSFGLEVTDDENQTVSSDDILSENQITTLTVTNDENNAPEAKFNVDRTSVIVDQAITFTSSSTDSDGVIETFCWDFEGDGFFNNPCTAQNQIEHTFNKIARDGVSVRLKVIDNQGAEAISTPVKIFVDPDPSKVTPLKAAFVPDTDGLLVTFNSNSTSDIAHGTEIVSFKWDIDTGLDSDGDGDKDNDVDYTDENPVHEYSEFGKYNVKLEILDSLGNKDTVTNSVTVNDSDNSGNNTQLQAVLLSDPAASFLDNKIHLQGEEGFVTFDFSQSQGDIAQFIIDKNIHFDGNGNNRFDDDIDYQTSEPGTFRTYFNKEWGKIEVKLTVVSEDGSRNYTTKEIVFEDPFSPGSANLLQLYENEYLLIIFSIFFIFGILGIGYYLSKEE